MNPGLSAHDASTLPLGYRGGGVVSLRKKLYSHCLILEQIRAWCCNWNKINWGPYGRLTLNVKKDPPCEISSKPLNKNTLVRKTDIILIKTGSNDHVYLFDGFSL